MPTQLEATIDKVLTEQGLPIADQHYRELVQAAVAASRISPEPPVPCGVFLNADGVSTERQAAEEVMMHLKLDNTDFRQRDPIVLIIGKHLERERQARREAASQAARETMEREITKWESQPPELLPLLRALLHLGTTVQTTLMALLGRKGDGIDFLRDVRAAMVDVQTHTPTSLKTQLEQPRVWPAHSLKTDVGAVAAHNRRRNGPVCVGCTNSVGFYTNGTLLGVLLIKGHQLQRMKAGDRVQLKRAVRKGWFQPSEVQFYELVISAVEGLCVHLQEVKSPLVTSSQLG